MTTLIEEKSIAEKIAVDRATRRAVSRESFYWFFNIYFSHYVKYETAEFQKEIFTMLEDEAIQMLVLVAFRGSGKSSIVTMAYVLWSILGKQQKKYAIIGGLTQRQARQHLQNIKRELETNPLLRGDLGPFREEQDEWGSLSLVISNCGAKITAASTEQSIRGMRHGEHRPDLIVCDDVEDLVSVKTREGRDKTHQWFSGDVLPAGDRDTRVIVVGNLLHEDSLVMRLREGIENNELSGIFKKYPFISEGGKCLWPGKFSDDQSIDTERKKIGSYNAWMREYMLVIIPDDDQVVLAEWIGRYDLLPEDERPCAIVAAIDPAISKSQTADYTAIVTAKVYGHGENMKIHILPHPINRRLNFIEQEDTVKAMAVEHSNLIKFLVEAVTYQQALIESMERAHLNVEGVPTHGLDKRARLSLVTPYLKSGMVVFPKSGAEQLIAQLIGFGAEKHDDLADAFAMLVDYCVRKHGPSAGGDIQALWDLNPHLHHPDPNSLWNMQF